MDVTIVIPVFNQLHYTRQCLHSLNASGCVDEMIVVVNNASTDGTAEFLSRSPGLRVIQNSENRACAAAWNQGFLASRTEWALFLNNDVVLPPGWLENLLAFAEKEKADIASPAMGEGELDYDLAAYARKFTGRMKTVQRRNTANGACFLVRRRVFEAIGNFDESFCRGGNEDDDFFLRARLAGFKLATTGGAYIHHFGDVTQSAVRQTFGLSREETIRYFRAKWKINWLQRRWARMQRKLISAWRKWSELSRHGHTLRERRRNGRTLYYG
jgi:N-acetylglucosaminyl-diphospho-decaprenol L-rhamnosyltransferase